MFAGPTPFSSRFFRGSRRLAAAVIWAALSTTPGLAQFDFLFGLGKPAESKPPAASRPAETHPPKQAKPKHAKPKPKKAIGAKPSPDQKANVPGSELEAPPAPYDTEILRLAEILGALTYLEELCSAHPPGDWRGKMQALLEADAKTPARKARLAGSYNRGFHDYERTYQSCTPNAQAIISRFLNEGVKLAHGVVNRYGGT